MVNTLFVNYVSELLLSMNFTYHIIFIIVKMLYTELINITKFHLLSDGNGFNGKDTGSSNIL